MAGGHFLERARTAKEVDRLLGPAVDGVEELHLLHAEVIVCLDLGEHLFDSRRLCIPTGLGDGHRRRLICQDIDRVLRRRGDVLALRAVQLDPVEALLGHREVAGERPIRRDGERRGLRFVESDPAARRFHGGRHLEADVRAVNGRDIAAWVHGARLQARVGREVVLEDEVLDRREIQHRHGEHRRAHAVGLHEVLGLLVHVEEEAFEAGAFLARDERHALERRARVGADHQRRFDRGEPAERGLDRLVCSPWNLRVARRDVDLVGAGRLGASRDDEQRRQTMAQERRAERHEQRRRASNGSQRRQLTS